MRKLVILAAAAALSACSAAPPKERIVTHTVTKEVKVPVSVRPTPPARLTQPVITDADKAQVFVDPSAPGVVLGVTKQGLANLLDILNALSDRNADWQAWATYQGDGDDPGPADQSSGSGGSDE